MATVVPINVTTAQGYQDVFEKAFDLPDNAALTASLNAVSSAASTADGKAVAAQEDAASAKTETDRLKIIKPAATAQTLGQAITLAQSSSIIAGDIIVVVDIGASCQLLDAGSSGARPAAREGYFTHVSGGSGGLYLKVLRNERSSIYIEDMQSFDPSNASQALLDALTVLQTGQTLRTYSMQLTFLDPVVYAFTALQESCSIYLPCTFIFNTANTLNGIDLDGAGFTFGKIEIGEIAYKSLSITDTAGPNVSTGVGIILRNFWETDIDVYQTTNYMTGTKLIGGGLALTGNGFALSTVRVRKAFCPKIIGAKSVDITTMPYVSTPGYFNSNSISCNFLRGQNGIAFTKGSLQIDPFNNNKIIETSIENIADVGINLDFASNNLIDRPRFEGGNVPTTWIKDSVNCVGNVIEILGSPDVAKILLSGNGSRIDGVVTGIDGIRIYTITMVGTNEADATGNDQKIYQANRLNASTLPNTICWGGIAGQDRWSKYAGVIVDKDGNQKKFGLLNPHGAFKSTNDTGLLQVPLGTSTIETSTTGTAALQLRMPADREINGYSILLDLTFFTHPISIQKSSGLTSIAEGSIVATGLYMLVYKSDNWKYIRLGNKLAV